MSVADIFCYFYQLNYTNFEELADELTVFLDELDIEYELDDSDENDDDDDETELQYAGIIIRSENINKTEYKQIIKFLKQQIKD